MLVEIGVPMDLRVRTFNELGLNAYKNKNYKLALEYFDEALEIDPDNHEVLLNKANVFLKRRSLTEAIGNLDRILNVDPENKEASKYIDENQPMPQPP